MNQCQKILEMLSKGPVTALDALNQANCFRLAARIGELRQQGHNIITEKIEVNNKHIAQYILKGKPWQAN
jgi:hypothetical protein